MFKRVLIANRGEIAVRIVRACREMGIESVVVFSDVDRRALHVRKADYAYHIGAAPAQESYLKIGKILSVAKISGAQAIHPGYGFLSENANFARACGDAGLKFVGPSAAAMNMMGSKTRARQAMAAAKIPLVPGSNQALQSPEEVERVSNDIGFPVMLKAAAGGGGKGMRLVHDPHTNSSPHFHLSAARPNAPSVMTRVTLRNSWRILATSRSRFLLTSTGTPFI